MNLSYLSNGQAVDVKQMLSDGTYLVEVLHEANYGPEEGTELFPTEELRVVTDVFEEAPTALFDERIEKLNEEIEALEARRREVQTLLRNEEQKAKDQIALLSKNEKLTLLEDFIAGRITHFVFPERYEIKTLDEALERENDWGRMSLRLLSLYGESKGDISWRVADYSDGSGSRREVIPCLSLDQARDVLRGHINAASDAWKRSAAVTAAKKYQLTVPQEWVEEARAAARKTCEHYVKKAEETLANAQAELAALDSGGA